MATAQILEVGENLKQNVKTLVDGVRKNQPSSDTALYASYGRDLYSTLKSYVALLSPSGTFLNKMVEAEAKNLKESVRQLLQKGKVAFVEGNANPENNRQMEYCARAMILSIQKISKAQSEAPSNQRPGTAPNAGQGRGMTGPTTNDTNQASTPADQNGGSKRRRTKGFSLRVKATNASKQAAEVTQSGPTNTPTPSGRQAAELSQSGPAITPPSGDQDDPEERKKAYHNMIRRSRRSISMAKANVQAMMSTMQQEEESGKRDRSKTMQQNKLLQQALAQIASMEGKMNEMEKRMEEGGKGGSGGGGPPAMEGEMMQMLLQLQQRLEDTEEAISREKRVIELEKSLKQKEQDMIAKEEAMAKRLESIMSRLDMDKFNEMEQKLKKLDQLDQLIANAAANNGMLPARGYDILKQEIERLQKVIFDPNASEKDIDTANIELEKVMKELEKCSEFLDEQRKQREEWVAKNEPLNKAAYERVSARLKQEARGDAQAFRDKLTKCGELALILLSKDAILKKHESDFKMYVLNLTEEELRGLRYNMPKFRPDQRVQMAFVDSIENKIKEKERSPAPPPPIPAQNRTKKKWQPKKGGGGAPGSFLEELKKRSAKRD